MYHDTTLAVGIYNSEIDEEILFIKRIMQISITTNHLFLGYGVVYYVLLNFENWCTVCCFPCMFLQDEMFRMKFSIKKLQALIAISL